MEQRQSQYVYPAYVIYQKQKQSIGWSLYWLLGWMFFGLPWLLVFWWTYTWPIIVAIMILGALAYYVVIPVAAASARRKRASQRDSGPSLRNAPLSVGYEQGYQEQGVQMIRRNTPRSIEGTQPSLQWDGEQPQASYPEQQPPLS